MPRPGRLGAMSPSQIAGLAVLGLGASGGGTALYLGVKMPATVVPRVAVAGVEMGGRTAEQAREATDGWWRSVKDKPVATRANGLAKETGPWTPQQLGLSVDAAATAASLPKEPYWPRVFREWRGVTPPRRDFRPVIVGRAEGLKPLADAVVKARPPASPAKVAFDGGKVERSYEQARYSLDQALALVKLKEAVLSGGELDLPLKVEPKHVPDEALDRVRTVIGQFTTRYDAGNVSRSSNIALAAKLLSGRVLMPGETFGFNDTLGERTKAKGFKEAGVYVSGRHDIDVGGGICQVSTTLYNSVLQAGLKVIERSSHSLPVAYVPLGQDATVSYPQPNFKFTDDRPEPVAIVAETKPGQITFRLLGATKEPGDVSIVNKLVRSWSRGIQYVHDPSLSPGREVVREKGGAAREVNSWRVVTLDGRVVKREPISSSTYSGGPRVVLVNRRGG